MRIGVLQQRLMPSSVDLAAAYAESGVAEVQEQLDRELIGLTSVKTRIREIAALLLVDQARQQICLLYTSPSPRDGLLSRMPSSA